MLEAKYQYKLIENIKKKFPGAYIFKNDPHINQGICDLLILYGPTWGMLEVKRSETASHRPNQDYYVDKFNKMSFARFIYPTNELEVLDAMERSLSNTRLTCLP